MVATRRAARRAKRMVMARAVPELAPASVPPLPLVSRQALGGAAAAARATPGPFAHAEGVRRYGVGRPAVQGIGRRIRGVRGGY